MKRTSKILFYFFGTVTLPGFILFTIFFAVDNWSGDRYELYCAIKKNDINTVQRLLAKNKYIINEKRDGLTPLHEATFASEHQIAALLLENGAKPNSKGGRGHYTPLFVAANLSDIEMMKLLIDYGARTDIRDDRSKSVFDYAREDSKENVLQFLDDYYESRMKR